ncbi:MAG: serine/threonine protein kinase [Nocardiopsaceae bacterium]|nr:serine/threonine protein kinase [Nocardiopsaceae bacterium]
MPSMTGRVIAGRYNLLEPLGRGAMGVVWRARDDLLDRDVAIKEVLLNPAMGDEERENAYQRTRREARTAARLSHRGVVTVYDVATDDGRPWIIMELVPSRSLETVLEADGPLSPQRACQVGQQLLAALAAAHAAGVMHRDVKPSNVLLADEPDGERAVLTDFGIAQFTGDPRLTKTGMVMGSPGFTAPERIRGGTATPASDLWSLGATLFAAVEGHGPYADRGGAITTMYAIIHEDAPPAPSSGPLGPLISALLRRDPLARPTAEAAARMFADVLPADGQPAGPDAAGDATNAGGPPQPAAPTAPDVSVSSGSPGNRIELSTKPQPPFEPVPPPAGPVPPPFEPLPPPTGPVPPPLGTAPRGRRRRGLWAAVAVSAVVLAASTGAAVALLTRHQPAAGSGGGGSGNASAPSTPGGTAGGRPGLPVSDNAPAPVKAIDNPTTSLPPGWTTASGTPSGNGAAGGFRIGVPPGWTVNRKGLITYLDMPGGLGYADIDLTKHHSMNMVGEAQYIEHNAIAQGHLPGYHRVSLHPATIRGTAGAFWAFTWVTRDGTTMRVDDLLFELRTPAGPQSYAVYLTAPAASFAGTGNLMMFGRILRTFEPGTS